jgi:antitoxin FitA
MGQILIRNLDDAILDALRRRAAATGASLEEEARRALAASVCLSRHDALARIDAVRAKIALKPGPDSVEDLHTDRRRDG